MSHDARNCNASSSREGGSAGSTADGPSTAFAGDPTAGTTLLWHHRNWRCEKTSDRLRLLFENQLYTDEVSGDAAASTSRSLDWLTAVRALDDPSTAQSLRLSELAAQGDSGSQKETAAAGASPGIQTVQEISVRTWTQVHENGWAAFVCDAPGDRYAAWAAPVNDFPRVDQLEDSLAAGQGAATMSLRLRSIHFECGARCETVWKETATTIPQHHPRPS